MDRNRKRRKAQHRQLTSTASHFTQRSGIDRSNAGSSDPRREMILFPSDDMEQHDREGKEL
ncbi:hypothetical protein L211DRAFT_841745 [Terfezia boudieri ATCC MYA-4762]|uniref:Uncharacterized protein n=1 Tax=Terfezia boudieri ATCC MYA-4762 TaxID=1051890 RepID=A0A3N4LG48_9PEZI|nr:hypothetical protein L211DRAFT_843159 [Terfezia boudieri ATCC MYA-4762]RPB20412.1 hypothetical protein L211DRAFT_841745 [Terfezia boudieri ATCC MYA-4762]